jgi:drug/metabolite transporter (DMT)-like permease
MRINRGILALLLAVMIWGSTFVVTKTALEDVAPFTLLILRFGLALGILIPLSTRHGYRPRLTFQPTFLFFGLTGIALYFGCQNLGLMFTSASSAALIQAGNPAAIALLSVLFLNERLTRVRLVGIFLAIAGTLLVSWSGRIVGNAPRAWIGNLILLGGVLAWALYTVQGKRLVTHHHETVITTASIAAGMLFLLPFALGELYWVGLPRLTLPSALAVLFLGGVASWVPLLSWNYALKFVDASVAAPYINLVPLVGVGLALLAGEAITLPQAVGGALALLGVALSTR